MPQVYTTFPGVNKAISCTYTRSLGTLPDVAIMTMVPQPALPSPVGTLTIGDGYNYVSFPNSRVDFASIEKTSEGQIETIRVFDRRWMWRFGSVDGSFNVRQADGTIRASTQRTPQQLAAFLLDALGELAYNVSLLPVDDYPPVEWDCTPARAALDDLLARYGCDINLDWFSDISFVVVKGLGAALPDNDNVMNLSVGIDGSETPDRIEVCGDFVLVQSKLKLEAVGIDTDGTVKPIDDLSYTPSGGWITEPESNDLLPDGDEVDRHLANQSVYRMFRAVSQADGSLNVPNYNGTVEYIDDLFPLKRTIIEAYDIDAGVGRQEAYVTGVFEVDGNPPPLINTDINTRLTAEFRLYDNQGILLFSRPITKLNEDYINVEPELYFVTSYHVRNPDTNQFVRFSRSRALAVSGTPTYSVPRMSLQQTIVAHYDDDGITVESVDDNLDEVGALAESMLNILQSQFLGALSAVVTYRGVAPVQLDGARRQVSWSVHRHRKRPAPCFTVASVNSEVAPGAAREMERRRLVATDAAAQGVGQDQVRRRKIRESIGVGL